MSYYAFEPSFELVRCMCHNGAGQMNIGYRDERTGLTVLETEGELEPKVFDYLVEEGLLLRGRPEWF